MNQKQPHQKRGIIFSRKPTNANPGEKKLFQNQENPDKQVQKQGTAENINPSLFGPERY